MLNFKSASALLLLLILAACGTREGEFPSLERRSYEADAPIAAPGDSASAPFVLSAEFAAKIDALQARHIAAHGAYLRELPAVQLTASQAARTAPGSEFWVNAHLMLSRLDKIRSDSVAALRDFDALIAEAGARDAGIAAHLTEVQRPMADDVAQQNTEIVRLSKVIGE
ncbi:MAG: hypothetical protein JHD25_08585 [Sphingomonadaceae bacterium]|nr:hypothetical protein [Sphingomonadaceae bacterium]